MCVHYDTKARSYNFCYHINDILISDKIRVPDFEADSHMSKHPRGSIFALVILDVMFIVLSETQ